MLIFYVIIIFITYFILFSLNSIISLSFYDLFIIAQLIFFIILFSVIEFAFSIVIIVEAFILFIYVFLYFKSFHDLFSLITQVIKDFFIEILINYLINVHLSKLSIAL
jgi:hypothetical protein